jgi:hypothetical protein
MLLAHLCAANSLYVAFAKGVDRVILLPHVGELGGHVADSDELVAWLTASFPELTVEVTSGTGEQRVVIVTKN